MPAGRVRASHAGGGNGPQEGPPDGSRAGLASCGAPTPPWPQTVNPALRAAILKPPPRRVPPLPRAQPETSLHEAVAELLATVVMLPAMWNCFPAGNVALPRGSAVKLTRMGLKVGWPDFIVIHGRAFGIELKSVKGRLSRGRYVETKRGRVRYVEGQVDVVAQLEAAGMEIAICRSIEDVLAALQAWQIPTRGVRVAA